MNPLRIHLFVCLRKIRELLFYTANHIDLLDNRELNLKPPALKTDSLALSVWLNH